VRDFLRLTKGQTSDLDRGGLSGGSGALDTKMLRTLELGLVVTLELGLVVTLELGLL